MLKAAQFAEDFSREGVPVWWDESDRVNFTVKRKTSRSRQAVERATEQDAKNKNHGRYYVPVPEANDNGAGVLPTFAEWLEDQAALNGLE